MDAAFLTSIQDNDYQIPDSYTLEQLTEALFANIGTPNEEVREDVYDVLSEWILSQKYTADALRKIIKRLIANLQVGLGETKTDTVFTRSFSVLLLGETVNLDNDEPYLTREEVHGIAEAVLNYVREERDKRDFVKGKGWAHAYKHVQYCLQDVLRSSHFSEDERQHILQAVNAILPKGERVEIDKGDA
jgi:hypothetical protein